MKELPDFCDKRRKLPASGIIFCGYLDVAIEYANIPKVMKQYSLNLNTK